MIRKRLLDSDRVIAGEKQMERMLLTLHEWGFVTLEPTPVKDEAGKYPADYKSQRALPNETLDKVLAFRSIHPIYGAFLVDVLGKANWDERLQIFESVLDMPRPMLKYLRPFGVQAGPLETEIVRPVLEQHGLLDALPPPPEMIDGEFPDILEEEDEREPEPWFAEKLRLFFETTRPETEEITIYSVWAAGELLRDFGGNFNLYISQKNLAKQEGIIFRHLLRLILMCEVFGEVTPADTTQEEWLTFLKQLAYQLTEACREIDPTSTSETIRRAAQRDSLRDNNGEPEKAKVVPSKSSNPKSASPKKRKKTSWPDWIWIREGDRPEVSYRGAKTLVYSF